MILCKILRQPIHSFFKDETHILESGSMEISKTMETDCFTAILFFPFVFTVEHLQHVTFKENKILLISHLEVM